MPCVYVCVLVCIMCMYIKVPVEARGVRSPEAGVSALVNHQMWCSGPLRAAGPLSLLSSPFMSLSSYQTQLKTSHSFKEKHIKKYIF